MSRLHDATTRQNLPKCSISIVRYQLPYAENMSDDLKELLTVADWTYKEVPHPLSYRAVSHSKQQTIVSTPGPTFAETNCSTPLETL